MSEEPSPRTARNWSAALLAAGSGLWLAACQPLAFPVGDAGELLAAGWLDPLALMALAPLLIRVRRAGPKRSFLLGLVAGTAYFGLSLYWLILAMTIHGHLPLVGAVPILLLLVVFLSLFWGLPLALCALFRQRLGLSWLLTLPLVWVAAEFLRNHVITGFPWAAVGYTQVRSLWLIQLSSLGGIYLVSGLVIFCNALLAQVWLARQRGAWPKAALAVAVLLLALTSLWAGLRLGSRPAPVDAPRLTAAVVQGNLDERTRLRGPAAQRWVFGRMLAESRLAQAEGAGLIVWPEATLPQLVPDGFVSFAGQAGRPPALSALLIAGGVAVAEEGGRSVLKNRAFLLAGDLSIAGHYDKRHLVPFGEYVPLGTILPWQWFMPAGTLFFSPGPDHRPLATRLGPVGMLICYEAIFPEIARESVHEGAQLLVNMTNDTWFDASSSPYQHLAMSRVRSIETDRYQLRAANTGVSAIIDSRGRELGRLPLGLSPHAGDPLSVRLLAPPAHLTGQLALLSSTTVYVFLGDWFPWFCAILTALAWFAAWRLGRRGDGPEASGV